MTHKLISRLTFTGLVCAVALALPAARWFTNLAGADNERLAAERLATMQAMALAEVAALEVEAHGYEGEPGLEGIVESWRQGQADVDSLRVVRLSGARLLASTVPSDHEKKVLPRRLQKDEKPLFDLGQRLRVAWETNREEGASRKEEIELEYVGNNKLSATAPYMKGDKVDGLVQLEMAVPESKPLIGFGTALLWALVLIGIFPIAIVPIGRSALGRIDAQGRSWGQTAVAAIILAVGLWSFGGRQLSLLSTQHAGLEGIVAERYAALRETATDSADSMGLRIPSFAENRWDVDLYRQPLGVLDKDGSLAPETVASRLSVGLHFLRRLLRGDAAAALLVLVFFGTGWARRFWRALVEHRTAYLYVAPAMLSMLVLVFFPFLYGVALSFTDANIYNTDKSILEIWIGLTNFKDILLDFDIASRTADGWIINYQNFYWTFFITVAWTVSNVFIGVSVGLVLALFLNTDRLALRRVYRVLLILPWAIPNYITALIWRGMFHRQFGVFNQVIQMFGGEPISWFDGVFSSFCTGVATNSWLSFPFMMVMCLGGLQAISQDMYEAARMDGAGRWQQLRYVTLPSLKPVLVPAIIISVVWTFNMFNIIFLVSGGEPGGANEILITQAYKIAFEKYRYGYAAAYSCFIFAILLIYGVFQIRMTKATEATT